MNLFGHESKNQEPQAVSSIDGGELQEFQKLQLLSVSYDNIFGTRSGLRSVSRQWNCVIVQTQGSLWPRGILLPALKRRGGAVLASMFPEDQGQRHLHEMMRKLLQKSLDLPIMGRVKLLTG